jgi:hypothetical protein
MFLQESVLLNNGFHFVSKCNCGGTPSLKYRRGDTLVKVFPKKNRFTINGVYHGIELLEEKTALTEG